MPLVRRSARFAMGEFGPLNRSWTRLHPSPGIWRMRSGCLLCYVGSFAPLLHSLGFRHLPSDSLLLRLSSQVLRIQKATLHPLVHLGDGPKTPLRVCLDVHLARGVILLPARGVGSRTIRLPMRVNRLPIADNGTISRMTRTIFVLLLWLFCWTTSSKSFQPPPNPWSSLPPNVFTSLRLQVWWMSRLSGPPISPGLKHMRNACDSAQMKFESRILEGRSLSMLLPSVSRTEKVSDSPCQGKAFKVNSQVYDLLNSKPSESRSIPLSLREAAGLETTLRSIMESYNFQLWTVTALFRLLGESGHFALDEPLLDQFQRSFSRGTENVAAGMAAAVAFLTTKRRESFLTHMVPSVTDAQKRKLLSDPLFNQKDLFAPTTIEAARAAARDVSLYRGAQSRPSTSSGTTQRRSFSSSPSSRGRPHSSPLSTPQRSSASSSSRRFQPKKKSSDPPKKRGGFRR